MSPVVDRFIRYVKIDTASVHGADKVPSTEKQLDLARLLMTELAELGLTEIEIDAYGNVTATYAANCDHPAPVVGLLAHMDTSPDMSGANVQPRLVEYAGGDIVLNAEKKVILSPREFPELTKYVGKTLITTDGTTLLGADDKAGVAEIMAALEYLNQHSEIKHGKLRIGFTTDEEVGKGIEFFDVAHFGADFAYTVDGDEVGALQYENFNAAWARVDFKGRSVHPGSAKNKMINAGLVAMEFNSLLPALERPEHTAGYEGFFHMTHVTGNVEEATLGYIIRDHDRARFTTRKLRMQQATEALNAKYGQGTVTLTMQDQYANMREKIEPVMYVIEIARKAMLAVGVTPLVTPVRGGTDGARLSWKGLPTPNIFTGGHNAHGKFEYVPVFALEKAVETLVKIAELSAA